MVYTERQLLKKVLKHIKKMSFLGCDILKHDELINTIEKHTCSYGIESKYIMKAMRIILSNPPKTNPAIMKQITHDHIVIWYNDYCSRYVTLIDQYKKVGLKQMLHTITLFLYHHYLIGCIPVAVEFAKVHTLCKLEKKHG